MPSSRPPDADDHPLHNLIAASPEGLLGIDESATVAFANARAAELLGVDSELTGRAIGAIGVPAIVERVEHCLQPGSRVPAGPIHIEVGERILAFSLWRATGRERMLAVGIRDESEIVERNDQVEAVLAATTDGLLVLSPDNTVTYANPAALEMLSTKRGKLIGTKVSIDELLGIEPLPAADAGTRCHEIMNCEMYDCPAYDAEDIRCWLISGTKCCDTRQPATFENKRDKCAKCEVHERNAELFDVLSAEEDKEIQLDRGESRAIIKVRLQPVIDDVGDYVGTVIVLRDVTTEHEIAQMKNEFVSTVSHELRTPLTSIKGYVDLILDGDAGEINEIQNDFLSIVKENSDRLVQLINDMLDISRIESGRIHLKVEPLSIAESIEGAVDTFRAVLTQAGRTIDTAVPDGLPLVAGDRDRIGQVLINLISNAIKYSPEGGNVTVGAKRADGAVVVSVADEGLGISREDQKQLFTKFYRVDSAMTRDIGGTGLGLSICKSIIELLGGHVWVESVLGEGSTFFFSVPVAGDATVRTPGIAGPESEGGTVLVVDRDPEVAALIETYLLRHGYEVVKAHSGEEALGLALRVRPSVITLDVILDDTDGFELIQRLKDRPETADIPVVVLSIVCDEGRSCRLGAANYLEKPIDQDRLLDVVSDLVGTADSPIALVVDDDRSVAGLLTETLRKRGFSVSVAYDGAEALAAIEAHRPDVMLLDLKMPKMDGYQVIKVVKSNPEIADIPIVVMTAYPIDRSRIDILEMTAAHISKPLSPEDIAKRVDDLFEARARVGEAL